MAVAFVIAALAIVAAAAFAVLAVRRGRRMHAAEQAVVALARSWSEDGSSRGRVCSAARLIAQAEAAFLAEPTRRGDALRITAAAGLPEFVGLEVPIDRDDSLLTRTFTTGEPCHIGDLSTFDDALKTTLQGLHVHSGHLRPALRGDLVVGVLGIGWRATYRELRPEQEELVAVLAQEASQAIARDAHVALLDRQARTDELTALPNRRAWDEAVVRELARAERTGEPLCLALVDLDHFKAYNDEHGHQAGDAHLRRTAALWRRELRTIDVLARYGGEEFGVLLPSCELGEAREVIDRVRAATPNGQTASAGVVLFDGRESGDELLARADAALYRAKDAGRAVTVPA